MEQFSEAVISVTAELRKLQEALKARSSDASWNLSAAISHLARINVWAVSIGLADPPKSDVTSYWPNASLSIQAQVRSLLNDLVKLCREATTMASESHNNRPEEASTGIEQALLDYFATEEPGSTSEIVSGDGVSAILADIEDIIDCLLSLAPSIRNGTEPKLTLNTSPTITESSSQLERDTQLVRTFFPTTDSKITDRLLMAVSWRRTLIASWQDLSLKTNDPGKTHLEVKEAIDSDLETRYHEGDSLQSQEKTSHPSQDEGRFNRRGSIYDQEATSSRVQPEKTIDATSSLGGCPAGAATCPICCVVIGRNSWNEHILKDLRPYICLVESCTDPRIAFMYHGDWVSHMVQKHWRSWNCPLCPSIECSSPDILQNHVSLQHPNEVPPSQLDSFIFLCRTSDSSRCKETCPLCSVFDIETSDQYQSHIGQHLEQLAASAFTDVPGKEASVGAEALIRHTSDSREQPSDAGPLLSKRPSTYQNLESNPRSSKKQKGSISPVPNLTSDSSPMLEPPQRSDSPTIRDSIAGDTNALRIIYGSESSLSPYRSRNNDPTSPTLATISAGVAHQGSDRNTQSRIQQSQQNASHTTDSVQIGSFAGASKGSKFIYLWSCCCCGHGGMNAPTTPACAGCGMTRCGNCHMEAHRARG